MRDDVVIVPLLAKDRVYYIPLMKAIITYRS